MAVALSTSQLLSFERGKYAPALKVWQDLETRTLRGMTELEQALLRRLLQQAVSNLS